MSISDWIQTRLTQIASTSEFSGGGKNLEQIDSNKEFGCLAKLLANCETEDDKKFVNKKMNEYLNNTKRDHFEWENGRSYDEVFDSTGNRMYIEYDEKGSMQNVDITRIDKQGHEVPDYRINVKDGTVNYK